MPDPIFDEPRLAALHDPLDPDRGDLDVYDDLVGELGARVAWNPRLKGSAAFRDRGRTESAFGP